MDIKYEISIIQSSSVSSLFLSLLDICSCHSIPMLLLLLLLIDVALLLFIVNHAV